MSHTIHEVDCLVYNTNVLTQEFHFYKGWYASSWVQLCRYIVWEECLYIIIRPEPIIMCWHYFENYVTNFAGIILELYDTDKHNFRIIGHSKACIWWKDNWYLLDTKISGKQWHERWVNLRKGKDHFHCHFTYCI